MARWNKQIFYANTPSPAIDPDLSTGTFALKTVTAPESIPDDKVLVRIHYLAIEPAMRQWLTAKRSYIAPVEKGQIMRGESIAQVLSVGNSLKSRYQIGDFVVAFSGWQEYALLRAKEARKIVVPPGGNPIDAISVLGMVGLTAYFGMLNVAQVKEGDTVVVSGAAGATGMIAGQIAKIKGAKKVIGLAGSADKCAFITNELGFDVAINYKDEDWKKQLEDAVPEYIDVFFDNVGGVILNTCLGRSATFARFVMCGGISQYNTTKPQGPTNILMVISQRITLRGFIVMDYVKQFPAALKDLAKWLQEGKIKRKVYIIRGGIEAAPQGLVDMYAGANTGKTLVEVAPMTEAIHNTKAVL